ncbi:hypothetical protein CONCODRAFT_168809 [Conidiobolus coronatus NRRL 28638]|uniref:Ser-Thr-rich glycosyl-phosphatidyl-inositol-anchored membrane family-domain-containing protein n=1 Tax=Conidiobolus coronatus (strain ATCC 28846 / CBS 209.66 / NRRL 28638) TaxID=796925 RepID=A0A137PBT9_CONC2|nr:hypothetical protein CONCODRAFT_168809 [Conidiobolus coronatus NRRL 28638]|eukprot:KXN72445.1 hypothetical protein CONCODRAFT_168809 [Conidiobolus coronatus NRRL 28638]
MKLISSLITSLTLSNVLSFTFNINSPYDTISWPTNTDAVIKFSLKDGTTPPPADFKVCIDLMRGDPKDSQQLLTISCDVPWNINMVYWKVPDFPTNNDYFVRVGSPAEWAYSHTFTIKGNGTTPLPKPRPTDLAPEPAPTATIINQKGNNDTSSSDNSGNSFRAPTGDYTYQPNSAGLDKDNNTSSSSGSSTGSKQSTKSSAQTASNMPLIILNLLTITSLLSL